MPYRVRGPRYAYQTGAEILTGYNGTVNYNQPWSYPTKYEYMTDYTNGRLRPNSPTEHRKSSMRIVPYTSVPIWNGNGISFGGSANRSCQTISDYIYNVTGKPARLAFEAAMLKKAYKKYGELRERWSSINFLAELGDIGAMFKRLDKYRYVDWSFAIKPFLQDCAEINSRLRETKASLNAKLASMRDSSRVPFQESRHQFLQANESVSFFISDSSFVNYGVSVRSSFKGEAWVVLPVIGLSSDNDEDFLLDMAMLDNQGFHPDLASVWEGIPFSWLVDWVLPVGKSLEALSGSWLNPTVFLSGVISTRVTGTFSLKNANSQSTPNRFNMKEVEGGTMDYYFRTPFGASVDSRSYKLPVVQIPKIDLSRSAILWDVFGTGTSIEDTVGKLRGKRR